MSDAPLIQQISSVHLNANVTVDEARSGGAHYPLLAKKKLFIHTQAEKDIGIEINV